MPCTSDFCGKLLGIHPSRRCPPKEWRAAAHDILASAPAPRPAKHPRGADALKRPPAPTARRGAGPVRQRAGLGIVNATLGNGNWSAVSMEEDG